jgi:hypothetical protein
MSQMENDSNSLNKKLLHFAKCLKMFLFLSTVYSKLKKRANITEFFFIKISVGVGYQIQKNVVKKSLQI